MHRLYPNALTPDVADGTPMSSRSGRLQKFSGWLPGPASRSDKVRLGGMVRAFAQCSPVS